MKFQSLTRGVVLLVLSTALVLCPAAGRAQDRPPEATAPRPELLAEAEQAYAAAQEERNEAAHRFSQLRSEIARATGLVEVSADGLRHAVEKLQEQQEQLLLDEAGAKGRREGLEEAIKEYTATATDRAASDEAVRQLEKVAAVREQELKRLEQLFKAGAVPTNEVAAGEAAVAQAQADVALAKQRAAGGTGPNSALDAWNREAMNLSIEQTERRARLQYIQSRLDTYKQVISQVSDLEQLAADLQAAEARRDAARSHLERIRALARAASHAGPLDATQPSRP